MKSIYIFWMVLAMLGITMAGLAQDVEDWVIERYQPQKWKDTQYRILLPYDYDSSQIYPLILSLHGGGGRGTDNVRQLRKWNQFLAEDSVREAYPCFVLAPQTTQLWNEKDLLSIKEIISNIAGVDMNRIYILGHSMGGHGTYIFTQLDPYYFAAAAPSAGSGKPETTDFVDVSLIKDIPFWIFHGDKDPVCPIEKDQKIFSEMDKIDGNMKFTTWVGDKHGGPVALKMLTGGKNGSIQLGSNRCDPEPVFMKWLFNQKLQVQKP